jgi:hypothetical protein
MVYGDIKAKMSSLDEVFFFLCTFAQQAGNCIFPTSELKRLHLYAQLHLWQQIKPADCDCGKRHYE